MDKATSPLANLVKTLEVTPPGAAAINITPKASSIGVFKIMINKYPTIGRTTNWQTKPTKNSLGFKKTLVKSFMVKEAPSPTLLMQVQMVQLLLLYPWPPYV